MENGGIWGKVEGGRWLRVLAALFRSLWLSDFSKTL